LTIKASEGQQYSDKKQWFNIIRSYHLC